jgi:hypothetical protein
MGVSKQVRTTISLPAASLTLLVGEALDESLKREHAKARATAAFARYQCAFEGFNEEELMILDGIIPEHRG